MSIMPNFHTSEKFLAIFKKKQSIGSQLARGAGGAFAVKIVAMSAAFFLQVVLARVLGLESFGVYIYALTWMNFSALFGRVGMDTASVKFVAAYNGTQNWSKLRGFLTFSNRLALSWGLLAGIAALVIFRGIDIPDKNNLVRPIWIACLILTPLNAVSYTTAAQLRGLKCIVSSQAANDIVRPLCILLCVIILYFAMQSQISASLALASHVFSALLVLAVLICLSKKTTGPIPTADKPSYEYRHWMLSAVPFLGIAVANLVIAQADILILGALGSPTEAGLYAPARRIGNLITIVLTSVNTIAAPLFSELYAQGKTNALQKAVHMAANWIFIFSVPCCIIVMIFAKSILLLFGPEFQISYRALQIIAGAQLLNALAGSVGFLMMMTDHQNKASFLMIICAIINLLLNFFLIPIFGIIGAALSNFVTTILWNGALLFLTLKYLHINPTIVRFHRESSI